MRCAGQATPDADFRATVDEEVDLITPEIELKWAYVERSESNLDFADADRLARFAADHAMKMHGHTLLWHDSIPPWAATRLAENADWGIVRRYLSLTIPRYGSGDRYMGCGKRTDQYR